jgi:hypothetical protein
MGKSKDGIKISYTDAYAALDSLSAEIDNFSPYTKNYLKNLGNDCESFNSDFNTKLLQLFERMKDDSGPKMLKNIEAFEKKARMAIKSIENGETQISKKIKPTVRRGRG